MSLLSSNTLLSFIVSLSCTQLSHLYRGQSLCFERRFPRVKIARSVDFSKGLTPELCPSVPDPRALAHQNFSGLKRPCTYGLVIYLDVELADLKSQYTDLYTKKCRIVEHRQISSKQ